MESGTATERREIVAGRWGKGLRAGGRERETESGRESATESVGGRDIPLDPS